ncbi:MAG: CAP domain-containing protein [Coriobacteriales bacterium]|jgi:uncharacterized protein YkwD|nr:CAP domain-containing protein [Coriobacteriales bacterium]
MDEGKTVEMKKDANEEAASERLEESAEEAREEAVKGSKRPRRHLPYVIAAVVAVVAVAGIAVGLIGAGQPSDRQPEAGQGSEADRERTEPFAEVYETADGVQIIAEQRADGSYQGRIVGLAPNGTNQYVLSRNMTAEPVGLIAKSALTGDDINQVRFDAPAPITHAVYRPNQDFGLVSQAGYSAEESRAIAEEMFERTNAYRAEQGLEPYIWDELLYQFAQLRASQLEQSYSHNLPNGHDNEELLTDFSLTRDTGFGEIITMGASTPESAVNAWIDSKGHRAHMLSRYQYAGMAVYIGENGRKYYVEVFYGWESTPGFERLHVPPPSETGKPPAYLTNPTAPETTPPAEEVEDNEDDIPVYEVPNISVGEDGVPIVEVPGGVTIGEDGLPTIKADPAAPDESQPTPDEHSDNPNADSPESIEIDGIVDDPDDPFDFPEDSTIGVDDKLADTPIEVPVDVYYKGVIYAPVIGDTNEVVGRIVADVVAPRVSGDNPFAQPILTEIGGHPVNGISSELLDSLRSDIQAYIDSGDYDNAATLAAQLSDWAAPVDAVAAEELTELKTAAEAAKAEESTEADAPASPGQDNQPAAPQQPGQPETPAPEAPAQPEDVKVEIPGLYLNYTEAEAINIMNALGFRVEVYYEYHDIVPYGYICDQSPDAGGRWDPQLAIIQLYVSLGPRP